MLAIELRKLELDFRYTTIPRCKIVALLRAGRQVGKEFFQTVDFGISQATYKEILE